MEEEKEMSAEEVVQEPAQDSPPENHSSFWKSSVAMFIGGAFVGLVLIVVGAALYFSLVKGVDVKRVVTDYISGIGKNENVVPTTTDDVVKNDTNVVVEEEDETIYTDEIGNYKKVTVKITEYTSTTSVQTTSTIKQYLNTAEIEFYSKAVFVPEDPIIEEIIDPIRKRFEEKCQSIFLCDFRLYESGKVQIDDENHDVYLLFSQYSGLGTFWGFHYVVFDEVNKSIIKLLDTDNFSYSFGGDFSFDAHWFSAVMDLDVPDFQHKKDKLFIPEEESVLTFRKYRGEDGAFSNKAALYMMGGILNIEEGTVYDDSDYTEGKLAFVDPDLGPVYYWQEDGTYHTVGLHGSVSIYDLDPYFYVADTPAEAEKDFYNAGYKVAIDWDVEMNPEMRFLWAGDFGWGCGGGNMAPCTNVVDNKSWFDSSNLVEIGSTTEKDEPVYELGDKATNAYYKEFYDQLAFPALMFERKQEGEEYTQEEVEQKKEDWFDEFLNSTPLFFWQDYMGNWRSYRSNQYRSYAECGKPVIYLYPEEAMDVNVQVAPNGGFTKVEPEYPKDGWTVHATPESELYNYADETTYPYLFWEGHAVDYERPKQGFVLAKEDVPTKMRELLTKLGLNEKESEDFLEFWEEKLMVKDYVFVTFLDQAEFDKLAPLTVSPTPDTVIRVFMDYSPLDEPVSVAPLSIKTPKRSGFTVVEWGGALK